MWPAMDYPSVPALQANALFASVLQRSDEPSTSQIRQAVAAAISALGFPGCAGRRRSPAWGLGVTTAS